MQFTVSITISPVEGPGVTAKQFVVDGRHTAVLQQFSTVAGQYEFALVKAYQFRYLGNYAGGMEVVEVILAIDPSVGPAAICTAPGPVGLSGITAEFLWQVAFGRGFESGFINGLH